MPTDAPTWDNTAAAQAPAWDDTKADLSGVKPDAYQQAYLDQVERTGGRGQMLDPSRAGEGEFTAALAKGARHGFPEIQQFVADKLKVDPQTVADAWDAYMGGAAGLGAILNGDDPVKVFADVAGTPSRKPNTAEKVVSGTQDFLADGLSFFATPAGAATLGLGSAPAIVQKLAGAAFVATAAHQAPEHYQQFWEAKYNDDPAGMTKAGLNLGLDSLMLAGGARYAEKQLDKAAGRVANWMKNRPIQAEVVDETGLVPGSRMTDDVVDVETVPREVAGPVQPRLLEAPKFEETMPVESKPAVQTPEPETPSAPPEAASPIPAPTTPPAELAPVPATQPAPAEPPKFEETTPAESDRYYVRPESNGVTSVVDRTTDEIVDATFPGGYDRAVDIARKLNQPKVEATNEQPTVTITPRAELPASGSPELDVREPAGPRAPAPPVGQTADVSGPETPASPAPSGSVEGGAGTKRGRGVRDRDPGTAVPGGRPSVPGQPAPAGPAGGTAPDPTQPVKLLTKEEIAGLSNEEAEKAVSERRADINDLTNAQQHYVLDKSARAILGASDEENSNSPVIPDSSTENHVLPADQDWIPNGDKAKVQANLAAIKLLKRLEAENRNPTPEEKQVLAKYVGWGGLKEVFDRAKAAYRERPPWSEEQRKEFANWEKSWGKLYDEVQAALTPDEYRAASASILNAHYTSREIINGVWQAALRMGFKGGKALEPAAGVGNFMGLAPSSVAGKTRWTAVELDSVSGRLLAKLYPQALVHQMGVQDAKIPANSQDLVITNVPFAADGPPDKRYPSGLSLHNYFFARALDLVKPGGIVAAITSDSTMDNTGGSKKAREYFADKADLVGAIRLPNNAFKKNAGTEVTTDILFFRKKDGTPFVGQPFTRTVQFPISKGEPVEINEYFASHPEMMLGRMSREGTMYRADQQALVPTPGDLGQKLAEAINKLPENVLGATTTAEEIAKPIIKAEAGSKLGGLVVKDGGIWQVQDDGTLEKPDWGGDAKKVAQAQRYVTVRDTAKAHIALMLDENATDADIETSRKQLNKAYDEYVKKHGQLNARSSFFLDDDVDYPLALALEDSTTALVETVKGGKTTAKRVTTFSKGKIFSERTIFPRTPPKRVDTVADGLQVSQNFAGRVDPDYIARLTGKALDQVFKKGIELTLKWAQDNNKFGDFAVQVGNFKLNGERIELMGVGQGDAKGVITPESIKIAWKFDEGTGGQSVSGAGFFHSLSATLERIAKDPDWQARSLANEQRNFRELSGFVKQPFEREVELEQARKRLTDLDAELKAEGEKQAAEAKAKLQAKQAEEDDAGGDEVVNNMGAGQARKSARTPRVKPLTTTGAEKPASELLKDWERFQGAVAPQTMGDPARFAANLLRQLNAEMANEEARADHALAPFRDSFDRTPVPKKWKYDPTVPLPRNFAFIDLYEGGTAATLGPAEAKLAAEFAKQNEAWLEQIHKLDPNALQDVYENYFGHLWDNPGKAKQVIAASLAKRPLQGSKSFLKQRTHELFREGLAAGLKPVHDNPVDLWMLKRREIARYILGMKFVRQMKAAGLLKFVHAFSKAPEGFSSVNDRAFQVYGPPTVTISEAFDAGMRAATLDVLKDLGVPHERLAKIGGMGRWGYESHIEGTQGKEKITTKFGGPDWVIWHELGHVLDNRYADLWDTMTATDQMEAELRTLADQRLDTDSSQNEKRYVRSHAEKMAVILQAYLHAPDLMQQIAPTIKKAFAGFLAAHPELAKINDIRPSLRLGQDTAEQAVGGLVKLGQWYMPDAAARVVNNYLSPGLNPHLWYRTLRSASNLLNGIQLGLSAFHLGFTSLDAAVSRLAIGIEDAVAGDLSGAVRRVASVPFAPVTNIRAGARLRAAVLGNITDGEIGQIVRALEAGGGRIGQDHFWQTQFTRRMVRAFYEARNGWFVGAPLDTITTVMNAPFALVEQTLRPIMEYIVPRQKLGVFADMAQSALLKLGDNASPEEVREAMRKAWDSVDNRMGQVVYDNLFYNRALKDVLLLTFRAYGWQLGKYREGLGAMHDFYRAGRSTFRGERPEFTHRMAYVMALPLLVGIIGATINYLMTGDQPRGLDYFMPRIGGEDPNGNPLRVNLPSYMKDAIHYSKHPVASFSHSLNPLGSSVFDLLQNKDFYDVRIRNPDDPLWQQGSDVAQWAGKQLVPFSISGAIKLNDDAAPAWKQVAPFFGITPAPSRMTMTPAQELASEITAAAMPKAPRTQEQYDRSKLVKQVVRDIKAGDFQRATTGLEGGLDKGILNENAAVTIIDRLQYTPLQFQVHNMTAEAAMRVWRVANPDERTTLAEILAHKIENSKTLPDEKKDAFGVELGAPAGWWTNRQN